MDLSGKKVVCDTFDINGETSVNAVDKIMEVDIIDGSSIENDEEEEDDFNHLSALDINSLSGDPHQMATIIDTLQMALEAEESRLLLLQKVWLSQHGYQLSGSVTPSHVSTSVVRNLTTSSTNGGGLGGRKSFESAVDSCRSAQSLSSTNRRTTTTIAATAPSGPQLSAQVALQNLEHQKMSRKSDLRRSVEEAMLSVPLPNPNATIVGSGYSGWGDIMTFVPSGTTPEFITLIGLEEVVNKIQEYTSLSRGIPVQTGCNYSPFVCCDCNTDFTPQWKRKADVLAQQRQRENIMSKRKLEPVSVDANKTENSADVLCESCVLAVQRQSLKKEYSLKVKAIAKDALKKELELDQEFERIKINPKEFEKFRLEQEKKLQSSPQMNHLYNSRQSTPNIPLIGNATPVNYAAQSASLPTNKSIVTSAVLPTNIIRAPQNINSASSIATNYSASSAHRLPSTNSFNSVGRSGAAVSGSPTNLDASSLAILNNLLTHHQNRVDLSQLLNLSLLGNNAGTACSELQLMLLQLLMHQNPHVALILASMQQQQQQQQQRIISNATNVVNPSTTNLSTYLTLLQQLPQLQQHGQQTSHPPARGHYDK